MKRIFGLTLILSLGLFGASGAGAAQPFELARFFADGSPNGDGVVSGKCIPSEWEDKDNARGTVYSLADGDTIRIQVGRKSFPIRMLSIDTPETHYNGMSQGYWGERAATRLTELLRVGDTVRVELGSQRCDVYGRMLGHVFKGEQNINRQMVHEGLAVNYCIFPNERYCRDYARLTERNIAEKRGMYSDSSVELPYEWRRRVSGREDDKWVGDMFTHEVFRPGNMDEVPVGNRMFFLNENQIHDPYRKVE